jgi:saccharopine dehydrogenase-like NADP-dependent oxidoreductase
MSDKKILVIGAGLSTPVLIDYLLENAASNSWIITVADQDKELAEKRIAGKGRAEAALFDVLNETHVSGLIPGHDLVISMLPAFLHTRVLEVCLQYRIPMITASYNPDNAVQYHQKAKENGILILNEIGLDPGIDHLSAMELLDKIREQGGEVISFKSSTGGLVAPDSDNNPWNYKFSWNPANVVKAGQNGAQYIENGMYKYIPYHQLFRRTEKILVESYGEFETYANRDSIKYREDYGLSGIKTMFRGTIRKPGFSKAWDALVQLGMTNDHFVIEKLDQMTFADFTRSFLPEFSGEIRDNTANWLGLDVNGPEIQKLDWLGLFSNVLIRKHAGSPASVLQDLLLSKWPLQANDKDMIVMQHQVLFREKSLNPHLLWRGKIIPILPWQ